MGGMGGGPYQELALKTSPALLEIRNYSKYQLIKFQSTFNVMYTPRKLPASEN